MLQSRVPGAVTHSCGGIRHGSSVGHVGDELQLSAPLCPTLLGSPEPSQGLGREMHQAGFALKHELLQPCPAG